MKLMVRTISVSRKGPLLLLSTLMVIGVCVFLTSPSFGADIRTLPSVGVRGTTIFDGPRHERDFCDIVLSGTIVPGDLDRLREEVAGLIGARWPSEILSEPPYRPLCLNSPGGSLGEAIRIAEFVHANSITTVLPPNSVCESACSWIFMLGHAAGEELDGPSRRMHISARLAVHAPHIDFGSGEVIRREPVEVAFNEVIGGFGVILGIANQIPSWGTRPFIDADFLEMAFTHSGNDWFVIDTVHKAGRWRIEVFGFDPPTVIDEQAAMHLCSNLTSNWLRPWSEARRRLGAEGIRVADPSEYVSNRGDYFFVEGVDNGYYVHHCLVDRGGNFCGTNGSLDVDFGLACDGSEDLGASGSNIAIFPSETNLIDLPRAAAEISARARAAPPPLARPCWLTSATARITNVNEYVNLRRQPDFAAPVIRQVPLGEQVRPLRFDNLTVIGQDRDRQACINACQAFGRNREHRAARDRAQQCINDNMLWYEITDARGNRGWVSRRYLEEVQ